jgi:hypothetical protein
MAIAKGNRGMMTRLWFVAAILIASHGGTSAKTYINTNYGFQVELPPGKVTCGPEYTTANHGFFVLWDTKDCLSNEDATGLYVEASYNALDLRSTVAEGRLICDGATIGPSPFWVAGYRFYQCKSGRREKPQTMRFFVLRHGKAKDVGEEMTYDVGLICYHNDCQKLLPMARWIFAHMKFIRREQ